MIIIIEEILSTKTTNINEGKLVVTNLMNKLLIVIVHRMN